jgi:putative effector of murein hydrolase LrgA (UPF0299 family)
MGTGEKLYSIFAILFIIALAVILILYPECRQLKILLPLTLVGLIVNILFMFIVLRDIFLRENLTFGQKVLWAVLTMLFLPVLVYLPQFGFRARKKPL